MWEPEGIPDASFGVGTGKNAAVAGLIERVIIQRVGVKRRTGDFDGGEPIRKNLTG